MPYHSRFVRQVLVMKTKYDTLITQSTSRFIVDSLLALAVQYKKSSSSYVEMSHNVSSTSDYRPAMSRHTVLWGCRGCPKASFRYRSSTVDLDNFRNHMLSNHPEVTQPEVTEPAGMVIRWGQVERVEGSRSVRVPYVQPYQSEHYRQILYRTAASQSGQYKVVLHGCVACLDIYFLYRASEEAQDGQSSVEDHVRAWHPGVMDWRGMWCKWGYRIRLADGRVRDCFEFEDVQLTIDGVSDHIYTREPLRDREWNFESTNHQFRGSGEVVEEDHTAAITSNHDDRNDGFVGEDLPRTSSSQSIHDPGATQLEEAEQFLAQYLLASMDG